MNIRLFIAALGLAAVSVCTSAQTSKGAPPTVERAVARATAPGQPNGGGYLTLKGGGSGDRLIGAQADVSKSVELHTMTMEGDVMRMRQVDAIDVPAGKTVELKPGGQHIMFVGLKSPLKAGDSFPLTLRFQNAGDVTVNMKVESPAGASTHMKH
jgi:copper(I)-binding protein